MTSLISNNYKKDRLRRKSTTKFNVKVFDHDYDHFDTNSDYDRTFLAKLQIVGRLITQL